MPNCADCGVDYPYLQKAHVIARHKGGDNGVGNLILICPNCHHLRDRAERVEWIKAAWTPERRLRQSAMLSRHRRDGTTLPPTSQAKAMRSKASPHSPEAQIKRSDSMKERWEEGVFGEERNAKLSFSMRGNKNGLGNRGRTATLAGRWSINSDACSSCGTSERPHKSHGLCNACYLKRRRQVKEKE